MKVFPEYFDQDQFKMANIH